MKEIRTLDALEGYVIPVVKLNYPRVGKRLRGEVSGRFEPLASPEARRTITVDEDYPAEIMLERARRHDIEKPPIPPIRGCPDH
ncbi:MAG: hypothetical protein ACRD26_01200 [Vicinamibacterales bacterium]